MNTNINTNAKLVGKEVGVQIIKPKKGPNNVNPPIKKPKSIKQILIEFINKQKDFNQKQLKFNKCIVGKLDKLENNVSNLNNKINNLENKLDRVIKLNNLKH